jgi:F0F1-type ATP synthase assembly protein I
MVYLILMLDNINNMLHIITGGCTFLLIVIGSTTIILIIYYFSDATEAQKNTISLVLKKTFKVFIPIYLLFIFILTFCPTTKQAATIYLLPKIANNKSLQELPSKTAEMLLLEVKKEIRSIDGLTDTVKKVK